MKGSCRLVAIVFSVCLAVAGIPGCTGGESPGHSAQESSREEGVVELTPDAAARAGIRVASVEERVVPFVLRTTGMVDFDERRIAHVSPRIPGRVANVQADLGDDVTPGQTLATLDSIELGEAKADYLTARAEETLARTTREREERLFEQKITSEQAALEALAGHGKALAHLEAAGERLRLIGVSEEGIREVRYGDPKASLFSLLAPLRGRIVDKHLVVGELVNPDDKVFTIADLGQLWIWIDVYERDLARVHRDDKVTVSTQTYPGRTFEGRVAYIRDEVDPNTRAARARIDLANPAGALKPGMFAEVVVTDYHKGGAGQPDRKALAIPPSAVIRDGDQYVVFVKTGERRYERRPLRIGARTEELLEVTGGLSLGEEVVVKGAFLLKSEIAKEEMGGGHGH